jgi:hypothetical protein
MSADETSKSWLRLTPTVPCSVVDEQATGAIAKTIEIGTPISRLSMRCLRVKLDPVMIVANTAGSRTAPGGAREERVA